jgi:choice-of-anchor A domain-containing protein
MIMRRCILAAAILVLLTQAAPCQAGFMLGAAADYAVLVEPGVKAFKLNNSDIFGNVGLGTGVDGDLAGGGFIRPFPGPPATPIPGTGRLDLADANTGQVSGGAQALGGVFFNVSQVTTALNTVNALNTNLGAEPGTALTISGGGQIINVSAGILDATGNRVFTVGASNNNNQGIVINGTASDFVVFNVPGNSNQNIGGPVSLSGGIISDHVLFNFLGSANMNASTGGAIVNGIILAPFMSINIDNINLNGRIFGGRAGTDFQWVSGADLFQPLPEQIVGPAVPEPSTLLLGFTGLGVMGLRRLVRRRAA